MKHLANSTKIFIETLERNARKVITSVDEVSGKTITKDIIKDDNLYSVFKLYKSGEIKLQDHVIEIAKYVGGSSSIDFVAEGDQRLLGLRSISNAKLNENEYFCPVAISMLIATTAGTTDADLQNAAYTNIDASGPAANGWLDIKVNEVEYLLREVPTSKFLGLSSGGSDAPAGMIFLDNFTIMKPQFRNEIILKVGQAFPANRAIKFLLHGTRTTPKGK